MVVAIHDPYLTLRLLHQHRAQDIQDLFSEAEKGEEDPCNDPDEAWYLYPNDEDGDEVYISGSGRYAYNKTMEKYISVQRKEYTTGYVKMLVAIHVGEAQKWKTMDFGHVCLQSFIDRRLTDALGNV